MPRPASVSSKPHPVDLEEVGEILKDIVEDDKRAGEVIRRLRSLLTKGDPRMSGARPQRGAG